MLEGRSSWFVFVYLTKYIQVGLFVLLIHITGSRSPTSRVSVEWWLHFLIMPLISFLIALIEPRVHKKGAMGSLKCIECGQIFDNSLNECPNCGCPASECENLVETDNNTRPTNRRDNVMTSNNITVNDLLNTDWANKVYECGVLYWNTLKKRYFNFSGRASRLEYWNFVFISFWVIETTRWLGGTEVFAQSIVMLIPVLILLIPFLAVSVRRMHDINRSGWWILVPWASIFLQFKKSDAGNNRYGEPSTINL